MWPLWVIQIIVTIALQVASYLLTPKPKGSGSLAKDLENPTAEAGRPVPVLFGTMTIKGLNVLHYTDKQKRTFKIKA